MAGVGEASAVLSTIQIGFSLAKTLYACVGDYRSAREEITTLATDVEATLTQAQELDQLVASNGTHQLLNERGLKLAEKCNHDSKQMVQKLLRLLTKAGVPERNTQAIGLNDIDVTRFGRAAWVFFKPEVLVAKRELDSIKLTMLVARSCIEAQSASTAADRDAAVSRIAGLERSRMLARRLLRDAQAENQKAIQSAASNSGVPAAETFSTRSEPPPRRSSSKARVTSRRQPQRLSAVAEPAPKPTAPASLDGHVVESVTQQIERDEAQMRLDQERMRNNIVKQLQQEESERKAREAAETLSREEAVETYKADVRRRLNATLEKSERMRTQLLASFSHELADAEVQNFIDAQNVHELQDDFVALMIDKYKAPLAATTTPADLSSWSGTTAEAGDDKKGWLAKLLRFPDRYNKYEASSAPDNRASEARYVHMLLTLNDSKRSILTLENTAFSHAPCGPDCNISQTTNAWTSLAEADQDATFKHLATAHPLPPYTHWHLHSAWSTGHQSSRRRRFLERALLGEQRIARNCSYVLAFSAAFSWQEMLKGAADRSERFQDPSSTSEAEKTAVATVADLPVQAPRIEAVEKPPEAASGDEGEKAEHKDSPAAREPPWRTRLVSPDDYPHPRTSTQHVRRASPHGARTGAQAMPQPSMSYPYTQSLVPYAQPHSAYRPVSNPFSPTNGFGQSPRHFPPPAQPIHPPAQFTGSYGASYNSMVPHVSASYPYGDPYPYAPPQYSYPGQPYMAPANPFAPDFGSGQEPTPMHARARGNPDYDAQTERPRRELAESRSRSRWHRSPSSSHTHTGSTTTSDEIHPSGDDSVWIDDYPRRRVTTRNQIEPNVRVKKKGKKSRTGVSDNRDSAKTDVPAQRQARKSLDDPITFDGAERRQPIRLPWHVTTAEELAGDASEDSEANDVTANEVDDDVLSNKMLAKYTNSTVGGLASEVGGIGNMHDTYDQFTDIKVDGDSNEGGRPVGVGSSDGWRKEWGNGWNIDSDSAWGFGRKENQKDETVIEIDADWGGFATAGKKKKKLKKKMNGAVVDFGPWPSEMGLSDRAARIEGRKKGKDQRKAGVEDEREAAPVTREVTPPPPEPEPPSPPLFERRPTVTIEEAEPEATDRNATDEEIGHG